MVHTFIVSLQRSSIKTKVYVGVESFKSHHHESWTLSLRYTIDNYLLIEPNDVTGDRRPFKDHKIRSLWADWDAKEVLKYISTRGFWIFFPFTNKSGPKHRRLQRLEDAGDCPQMSQVKLTVAPNINYLLRNHLFITKPSYNKSVTFSSFNTIRSTDSTISTSLRLISPILRYSCTNFVSTTITPS